MFNHDNEVVRSSSMLSNYFELLRTNDITKMYMFNHDTCSIMISLSNSGTQVRKNVHVCDSLQYCYMYLYVRRSGNTTTVSPPTRYIIIITEHSHVPRMFIPLRARGSGSGSGTWYLLSEKWKRYLI